MLLLLISIVFVIFIKGFLNSFHNILLSILYKKPCNPIEWWFPGIIGGIWFFLLMIYLK